jgi:hypothetical protein
MIAEGLRLLREQKLHQLRLDVSAGLEQLDQGESVELEDEKAIERFFDDIKARGRERLGTQ